MNSSEHIEVEDLVSFVLLLLDEEDATAVREHTSTCDRCQDELKQVRLDLEIYALAVEPIALPEGARSRFMERLTGEAVQALPAEDHAAQAHAFAAAPLVATSRPTLVHTEPLVGRSAASRILPWAGWAAAAAAIVVAAGLKQDRDALRSEVVSQSQQTAKLQADAAQVKHVLGTLTDPAAVRVNLTVPKAPIVPAARATYEPKSGTLLLLASNLQPIAAHKVYELWLIPADGGAPVPAGTFSPDAHGNASLLVPALHGAIVAKAFGITLENVGGSTTPTMPILLAGAPA